MDDIEGGIHRLRQRTRYLQDSEEKKRKQVQKDLTSALDSIRAIGGMFSNRGAEMDAMAAIRRAIDLISDERSLRGTLGDFEEVSQVLESSLLDYSRTRELLAHLEHEFRTRHEQAEHQNWELRKQLTELTSSIERQRQSIDVRTRDLSEDLTIQSSLLFVSASPVGDSLRIPRFIPYELYVGSDDYDLAHSVHGAFLDVIKSQGFISVPSLPVVFSSHRMRGVVKTEPLTRDQFERLLVVQEEILRHLTDSRPAPTPIDDRRREEAELDKLIAETEKIRQETSRADTVEKAKTRQETFKAGSETGKNVVEALDKFSGLMLKAGVAIGLLFGHVSISNSPQIQNKHAASCADGIVVTPRSREEEIKMVEDYIRNLHRQEFIRITGHPPEDLR